MTLPKGFLFTQSNLQDYVDCQRRFQLRYLIHLAWPTIEAEPYQEYEQLVDLGVKFHRAVRQHLAGIPEAKIDRSIQENLVLQSDWNSYKESVKGGLLAELFLPGNAHFEELSISIPIDNFRLVAKYDVLIENPNGKVIILDWKTSRHHPPRKWLGDRLQTHVYPFILLHQIPEIPGGKKIKYEEVEMIYWFSNHPDQPERFPYSISEYQSDAKYLENLTSTISLKSETIYPLTPDTRKCQFCNYRSFCDRGMKPGSLDELENVQDSEPFSEGVTLDYEQVSEIEF